MQKLGILASVLLLASVIIGPLGLSYAQTVDTAKKARESHDEVKTLAEQQKAERLAAQIKKAAEIKAAMNAKKEAAAKEIAAAIAARNAALQKDEIPRTADLIAKLKAAAKEQIDARKAAGGPSKVQKALEQDRAAFAQKVAEHKMSLPKAPEKDHKYTKDDKRGRDKTLKSYDAVDQYSKESELKKEDKKAISKKEALASQMHYNRK
jgi:hypothetical protein